MGASSGARRGFFDRPLMRDPLAVTWLVLSCLCTIGNLVYWGPPTSVSSIVFSAVNTVVVFAVLYIVVGIGGGFVREAVRGYRDAPRPTNGPSG